MSGTSLPRTIWAEQHVESFIAPSFVAEFVFRSPQITDVTQKEVADFLIHRPGQALLISQKCQDDPTSRSGEKLKRWARKKAEAAVSQLQGTLKRVGVCEEIWCEHWRRGRVSFPNGLPQIDHAIATVEVFERVSLQDDLPLQSGAVPISYLSVSDFMNVCTELRTVPEVLRYLNARRTLPPSVLLTLGSERTLFGYYLLHDGTFEGFSSLKGSDRFLSEHRDELNGLLHAKSRSTEHARSLEHVADQLAGRHPHYRDGLSQAVLGHYEPDDNRRMYLVMQDLIAGMTLGERACLGQAFDRAIELRRAGSALTHVQAMVGSHPDYVFIFGSFRESVNMSRDRVLSYFRPLATAAMTHYRRRRSLIVFDRDGESYEVAHGQLTADPTADDIARANEVFGHLKMSEFTA